MASEFEREIQQHLSRYLDGTLQRYELEDWLIPKLWDLAESSDEAAREIAGHIHNLIAETSNGDRSPESLDEELKKIARPFAATVRNAEHADGYRVSRTSSRSSVEPRPSGKATSALSSCSVPVRVHAA
jgi:hypothetical protein